MSEQTAPEGRAAGLPRSFETERLRLRPLQAEDRDLYVRLYTDAAVMRYVGAALSRERAQRAFQAVLGQMAQRPPVALYWAVQHSPSEPPFGLSALVFDGDRQSAEAGILLLPQEQGRGYATEVVAALANRTFFGTTLRFLRMIHSIGHPAMPRVLEKLDFVCDGIRDGLAHWRLDRIR